MLVSYSKCRHFRAILEVSAHIATFVQAGIEASRKETLQRAADMEVALAIAITKRYNMRDELILSKLTKWQGRSAINWDSAIEMLKGEVVK